MPLYASPGRINESREISTLTAARPQWFSPLLTRYFIGYLCPQFCVRKTDDSGKSSSRRLTSEAAPIKGHSGDVQQPTSLFQVRQADGNLRVCADWIYFISSLEGTPLSTGASLLTYRRRFSMVTFLNISLSKE